MMMLFTNNASSRLYAAIDAVTTSIRVQAGDGTKFPTPVGDGSDYFAVTIEDRRSGQIEICNCTARSGDIFQVQRGKEGTLAQAFELGATVSNRLTAATMDFLAHAGATGPQGPQGDTGPVGPMGPQGPTGATGAASTTPGPPGPQGQTGSTGPQGPAGTPGAQGPIGSQGSQGPKGDTGPAGPAGPEGPEGAAGTGINMQGQVPTASALPSSGNQVGDAYVTTDTQHLWVWSEEGYWADLGNVVGPMGPVGPQGPQGVAGPQGVGGPPGQQGIPGPEGPEGPQGTTDWVDLTNKPATFPPTLPVPWTGISGQPATYPPTLPIAWTDVSGKPSTFPPTLPIAQSGVTNLVGDLAAKADLNSPTFTGTPTAPTPSSLDTSTKIATTAFVQNNLVLKASLNSPTFTGDPKAPTPATTDNDTSIATSAFVRAAIAAYAISDAPADGLVYGRKDNNWATVIGGASTSDGPPSPPLQNGQLWWETDTGNLHIYYNDGNSSQWVQLTGQPSGGTTPNIEAIASANANMLAGFKTGPNRFAVNSQADGLGFDVLTAYRSGVIQLNGLPLSFYASSSPNLRFAINASADGTGTEVFSVDNGGSTKTGILNVTGTITASGQLTVQNAASGNIYAVATSPLVGFCPNNNPGTRVGYIQSINGGVFTINGENANLNILNNLSNGVIFMGPRTTATNSSARVYISYLGLSSQFGLNLVAESAAGTSYPLNFSYPPSTLVGSVSHTATTTAYNTTSDERLKEFGEPLTGDDAIAIIRADPVRHFTWTYDDTPAVGWGAQTSYAISPDLATPGDELGPDARQGDEGFHPWGMDQGKRTPYLWAALAAALDKIDALEARLAALEGTR